MSMMKRILLTNDDGWDSPGLHSLKRVLNQAGYEVWVMAPSGERSGTSHSISLHNTVRVVPREERGFSCSGTPADCVLFSLRGAVPDKVDLVLSGINRGPNIGTDIIYSGTAAAARQAALMGTPAAALSLNTLEPPFAYEAAARWFVKRMEEWEDLMGADHFLNVNFPAEIREASPAAVTFPSKRVYLDELEALEGEKDQPGTLYQLRGNGVETSRDEGSDWAAVVGGSVSVTPVFLHPVMAEESPRGKNGKQEEAASHG